MSNFSKEDKKIFTIIGLACAGVLSIWLMYGAYVSPYMGTINTARDTMDRIDKSSIVVKDRVENIDDKIQKVISNLENDTTLAKRVDEVEIIVEGVHSAVLSWAEAQKYKRDSLKDSR